MPASPETTEETTSTNGRIPVLACQSYKIGYNSCVLLILLLNFSNFSLGKLSAYQGKKKTWKQRSMPITIGIIESISMPTMYGDIAKKHCARVSWGQTAPTSISATEFVHMNENNRASVAIRKLHVERRRLIQVHNQSRSSKNSQNSKIIEHILWINAHNKEKHVRSEGNAEEQPTWKWSGHVRWSSSSTAHSMLKW